ncbi:Growth factor receptor-bound protein 10 [Plecturocebus cupreus]
MGGIPRIPSCTLPPAWLEAAELGRAGSGKSVTRLSRTGASVNFGRGLGAALRPLGQPSRVQHGCLSCTTESVQEEEQPGCLAQQFLLLENLKLFICKYPLCVLQDVKVFSEDGTSKVVEILADMTARDLCQLLVYKSHCVDDNSWTLVEHHPHLGLERCLEDHELVVQVESTMASESKFLFRKNYAKYEFFKNPMNFFPEQMVTWCQQSNGSQSQLLQNFLNSSSCPEIQGFLHVKELGKKSWKKLYVCLRRSGLYCSTKGTSKEPRHLQLLADLDDSNIFSLIAGRKQYSAPTDHGLCIKPNKVRNETKELRLLCAEDEQTRTCWMTAFRLLKVCDILQFVLSAHLFMENWPLDLMSILAGTCS